MHKQQQEEVMAWGDKGSEGSSPNNNFHLSNPMKGIFGSSIQKVSAKNSTNNIHNTPTPGFN